MSLHILASGSLIGDPVRRSGSKVDFTTATIKVATEDGSILMSVIAFGDIAQQLLSHHQGNAVAISGRGKLSAWTGRDGAEQHGLSVVAEQIASAEPRQRSAYRRQPRSEAAPPSDPRPFDDEIPL